MDAQYFRSLQEAYMEVVENQQLEEGMTMRDFKANRQENKRRDASADAVKRGHVGKEWYNSGRRYSPDEAKRMRSKLDDEERRTRHRSAVEPDNENDDDFSADKTKNPKKLRKQKAMGELGEQNDIYDIILSHLLDEGYAETPEAAEAIMVNMSEDWRDEIVEKMLDEALTGYRGRKAIRKFQDQNDRPNFYRKPGEIKNPSPNYTLGAVARNKEGSPNPYNPSTPEDYRDSGNRPTRRGGRGGKGEPKTGYYGTDRRDSDRGRGNAARRRMKNR